MAGKSILIIDDESGIHEILEFYFSEIGASCSHAYNGKEAIKMISENEYDVVLCDIAMPGVNGLEVLQAIRATKINVPFIFISGAANKDTAIQALRLGAHDLIEKPFEKSQILKVVKSALGNDIGYAPMTQPAAPQKLAENKNPLASLRNTISQLNKDMNESQSASIAKTRLEYLQKIDEQSAVLKPMITKAELSGLARLMHNIKTIGKSLDASERAENIAKALESCYICLRAISKIDITSEIHSLIAAHKLLKECIDENTSKNVSQQKADETISRLRAYEDVLLKKLKSIV
ncbi:MAG: response regulator [Oligoflexales bacterium]